MARRRVAAIGLVLCVGQATGCSTAAPAGEQSAARWDFDKDVVGQLPAAWSARQTRPTKALATWQVVRDTTAPSGPNALALTRTENHNGTFNLAVAESTTFRNIDLTVKVKGVRGEEDQGGGPIWRCRDENNYYICRFNPLEGNYRMYKVENGRRRQLQSAEVETDAGRWYTVRVVMVGDRIACYLDGTKHLEVTDETFPDAGKVGLWTNADAVTSFDDLAVREVSAPAQTEAARLDAAAIGAAAGTQATTTPDGVVSIRAALDRQQQTPRSGR